MTWLESWQIDILFSLAFFSSLFLISHLVRAYFRKPRTQLTKPVTMKLNEKKSLRTMNLSLFIPHCGWCDKCPVTFPVLFLLKWIPELFREWCFQFAEMRVNLWFVNAICTYWGKWEEWMRWMCWGLYKSEWINIFQNKWKSDWWPSSFCGLSRIVNRKVFGP